MFLGEYTHTIDDKGRLTIPAKFRGELAAGLVVTVGMNRNLMLFPLAEWEGLAQKIANQPFADTTMLKFRRLIFPSAVDLTPDRQGRILLPNNLREFASLDGEVVITGMFNYLEIWSTTAWQAVRAELEESNHPERWDALGI
jgi:MraZ protein